MDQANLNVVLQLQREELQRASAFAGRALQTDDATANLILSLQLQELRELEASFATTANNLPRAADRVGGQGSPGAQTNGDTVPENSRRQTEQCAICLEEYPSRSLIQSPCQCLFCRECFLQMVQNAVRNEGSFPARCIHGAIHI